MTQERRQDDKALAVLIQQFKDFIENTDKYRMSQERLQTNTSNKLDEISEKIYKEINALRKSIDTLPCPVHQTRIEDMGKSLIGLWSVVSLIGAGLLTELIRFWNKKCP